MTRNGIVYDLTLSPYILKVEDTNTTFYFSSKNHMEKFRELKEEHRARIKESLSNRFGLSIEENDISDIVLYGKVETRGFHIIFKGSEFTCKKHIKLSGERKIKKS